MRVRNEYLAYVLDQLAPFARVAARRMFGGVGLYVDQLFFGLIADEALYLKADDSNRDDYVSRGCPPFMPYPEDRVPRISFSYYQVPADVLEDSEALTIWARKAQRAAAAASLAKARRPTASNKVRSSKKAGGKRPTALRKR
jgi:DNA transformation protein